MLYMRPDAQAKEGIISDLSWVKMKTSSHSLRSVPGENEDVIDTIENPHLYGSAYKMLNR